MSDIKKRVLDLLFESDSEEVTIDAPLKDLTTNKKKESSSAMKAKDVLYGDKEFNPSFIDYEPKTITKKVQQKQEKYELKSNISPIFGVLSEAKTAKAITSEIDTKKATESNNANDYLNVIISPIYGYDDSKANSARGNLKPDYSSIRNEINNDADLDNEAFDMHVDSLNETIKEAVQEAVIEFNPIEKKDEYTDDDLNIYDTLENRLDDIVKNNNQNINSLIDSAAKAIDDSNVRKEEYKENSSIKHSELVNNYATILETGEFPIVDDDSKNQESDETIIENYDDNDQQEDNDEIFEENIAADENSSEAFEDDGDAFLNEEEKEEEISETIEKEQEDDNSEEQIVYEDNKDENIKNENISLFDFDDVVNDSDNKDIFDELIGDDE